MAESVQFATCANALPTAAATTFEQLQAIVDRLVEQDPIGAWMRERGFDPARGCLLIAPEMARAEFGPFPPHYVCFSRFATAVTMVDVDALGLGSPDPDVFPLFLKRGHAAVITRIECP